MCLRLGFFHFCCCCYGFWVAYEAYSKYNDTYKSSKFWLLTLKYSSAYLLMIYCLFLATQYIAHTFFSPSLSPARYSVIFIWQARNGRAAFNARNAFITMWLSLFSSSASKSRQTIAIAIESTKRLMTEPWMGWRSKEGLVTK